jgi:tRNA wybutosine-synthesizing protein 2
LLPLVPRKWEKLGRIAVLRIPPPLRPYAEPIARAFAAVLGVDTVLDDEGGVGGEFREMRSVRVLLGSSTVAEHRENGITFRFDAARIMFASGNTHERVRMARIEARNETVADLFAGIGYFTMPLLVHAGAARVIACEKNPVAFAYLLENAHANGVQDRLEARLGDCRNKAPRGVADRVLLGYFPGTEIFLSTAFHALRPEGGTLHYHNVASTRRARAQLEEEVDRAARTAGRHVRSAQYRVVKSYAPGVVHAVLDAAVGPAELGG